MANSSILNYSFQPNEVFISTSTDMKMIIKNPNDGDTINFKGGPDGDSIDIIFPIGNGDADLVSSLAFTAKAPTGCTCAKSGLGNYFTLKFINNSVKLLPGQQMEITFLSVPINSQCKPSTPAVIKIKEYLEEEGSAAVDITKRVNNTLDIIAWADPSTVALKQFTTLYWQSTGGTKVVIGPFNSGDKEFPVEGPPPSPGTTKINIPSDSESQRTYTLKVYTSDQQQKSMQVTITQNPPLITLFEGNKSGQIAVDESMVLDWFYLWGTSSSLNSNSGLELNNPRAGLTVYPGKEVMQNYINNYANMPAKVYYELGVNGFKKAAMKRVEIQLLPVNLVYFKYASKDAKGILSGLTFKFDPEGWIAYRVDVISSTLTTLTLYQPGGKTEVYYLGSGDTTHPQIQYFNYISKGDGVYELSWVTANLVKLELTPGGDIPAEQINSGTKNVNLTTTTSFTLKGTAKDGSVITSTLNVII